MLTELCEIFNEFQLVKILEEYYFNIRDFVLFCPQFKIGAIYMFSTNVMSIVVDESVKLFHKSFDGVATHLRFDQIPDYILIINSDMRPYYDWIDNNTYKFIRICIKYHADLYQKQLCDSILERSKKLNEHMLKFADY